MVPFVSRIAHKRLTYFGGHGQQQRFYVSQPQRKDPQCLSFLARSSILPLWLGSSKTCMVPALNTAVDLKSLHSQSRRASVRHALKALRLRHSIKMITSQVQFQIAKFKFRQYQNTTFFRHFAKFNARQIFPLYGIKISQKFSCESHEIFPIYSKLG